MVVMEASLSRQSGQQATEGSEIVFTYTSFFRLKI
jgi:hypothetical protein